MNEVKTTTYSDYVLPPSVVSKVDMARLVRDLERIDNELTEVSVRARTGAGQVVSSVTVSDQLRDFLALNKLSIPQDSTQRTVFVKQLRLLADKAPVIHMTFAVEVDRGSLAQIAAWLRKSIHTQALVQVGLQPGLVAGVYVRTTNHVYDMSLRAKLKESRSILTKHLEAARASR